jgi:hypothetical protein
MPTATATTASVAATLPTETIAPAVALPQTGQMPLPSRDADLIKAQLAGEMGLPAAEQVVQPAAVLVPTVETAAMQTAAMAPSGLSVPQVLRSLIDSLSCNFQSPWASRMASPALQFSHAL